MKSKLGIAMAKELPFVMTMELKQHCALMRKLLIKRMTTHPETLPEALEDILQLERVIQGINALTRHE